MTIMKQKWSALPVPHATEVPVRVPKASSFGPDFCRMERELQWRDSNSHRDIDGFRAGLPTEKLLPGLRNVNPNPLEQPVAEIEI
jgi:hypothetical protein